MDCSSIGPWLESERKLIPTVLHYFDCQTSTIDHSSAYHSKLSWSLIWWRRLYYAIRAWIVQSLSVMIIWSLVFCWSTKRLIWEYRDISIKGVKWVDISDLIKLWKWDIIKAVQSCYLYCTQNRMHLSDAFGGLGCFESVALIQAFEIRYEVLGRHLPKLSREVVYIE